MLILDFGIENRNVCPTVPYPLWVFYVIIYGPYRWSLIILPFAASCASLFLAPTATVDWKYDPEMGKETKMSFQKEEQLRFTTRRSFSQLDLNNCIPTGSLCWPIVREDTFWFVQVTTVWIFTFLVWTLFWLPYPSLILTEMTMMMIILSMILRDNDNWWSRSRRTQLNDDDVKFV